MPRTAITEIAASPESPFLRGANWADAFVTTFPGQQLTAPQVVERMFAATPPAWARFLTKLRDGLGSLIGLKPGHAQEEGSYAGSFPLTHLSDDTVVFGFDDWHLDFRVVVEVIGQESGSAVIASTLVRRKHWFGYAYITLISPFHKMIVRRLLRNVAA